MCMVRKSGKRAMHGLFLTASAHCDRDALGTKKAVHQLISGICKLIQHLLGLTFKLSHFVFVPLIAV